MKLLLLFFLISQGHSGSDSFGYTFIDSDTTGGPSFVWIDASGGDTLSLADDDNWLINLPFPFPFYTQTLRQLYVVSNGYLTSSNTRAAHNIHHLPNSYLDNLISPFWDDLNPASGGHIFTRYIDSLDAFVVEWDSVPHYHSGGPYSFEVIFYHNGDIVFSYLSMEPPVNYSTVGIQGGSGTNGYYIEYIFHDTPFTPHDSLSVYFSRPRNYQVIDASPTAVIAPSSPFLMSGETFDLSIEIMNASSETLEIPVNAEIRRLGGDILWSGGASTSPIPPFSLDTLTFQGISVDSMGIYSLNVTTDLSGDTNYVNDTLTTIWIAPSRVDSFENDSGNFVSNEGWEWGVPGSGPGFAHSGQKLWGTVLSGNYPDHANFWLIGDFLVEDTATAFGFYHWYDMERRMDGGNILYTVNHDTTWQLVEPEGGYPSYVFALQQDGYTGNSGGWKPAIFILHDLHIGDTLSLAFHFKSGNRGTASGWYLDDFCSWGLNPIPTVSVEENPLRKCGKILLVGNVSKNGISYSITGEFKRGESLEIYDVSGRLVLKQRLIAREGRICIGNLSNGMYFVKFGRDLKKFVVTFVIK